MQEYDRSQGNAPTLRHVNENQHGNSGICVIGDNLQVPFIWQLKFNRFATSFQSGLIQELDVNTANTGTGFFNLESRKVLYHLIHRWATLALKTNRLRRSRM